MLQTASEVRLKKQTLKSFEAYIQDAEAAMEQTVRDPGQFLWSDRSAEKAERVRGGEIVAEFDSGHGPIKIPSGLIHDWIGVTWMPGTTLKSTLRLIQNYDNHANIYKPEVIASKLISRSGNDFEIYLRLLKKKIVTVVLDTDHSVHYGPIDRSRWVCQSYTTRIAEVENAGHANERVLPPDTGFGFLWRLNSYWRFQEREGGVYAECRAISLTRDVPLGLGWIIEPIIQKLPKESLIHTLECTRQALLAS
jgi:IS1 family transposase